MSRHWRQPKRYRTDADDPRSVLAMLRATEAERGRRRRARLERAYAPAVMSGKRRQTSARSSPPAVQAAVVPVIDAFTGPYFFLSNFAEIPVDFEGAVYPTVEHAFAAAKTLDPTERELIRLAARPGEAKRLGRQVALRPGWDDLRVEVMRGLLARKFAPGSELAARLLATGDAQLIERNTWGDRFWGVCRGHGRNQLGQLLMEWRDQLRRGLAPEHPAR